jgi:Site-specific recombinases, DNA invertase Pin homologs
VIIFARVSTNVQDYERQINELTTFTANNGRKVEAYFAEKISGAKSNKERTELLRIVEFVEANNIDKVIVTELSYLGRDTLQVTELLS